MAGARTMPRLGWLWLVVPLVAGAELYAQWRIPHEESTQEEWSAVAKAIRAEKKKLDLVVIAPDWATQGRIALGSLLPVEDFGRFDTTTYERLYEISWNGARAPESAGLTPESQREFGHLTLNRYKLPPRATPIYDFVKRLRNAETKGYRRQPKRIVIDHWFFPRDVIPVPLRTTGASLTYPNVPLDGVLRGYGIVGYRSGRFNKGGPITFTVFVDDKKIGEQKIANFGPLQPFRFELKGNEKATGEVRFEIKAKDYIKREFGFAADVRREPGHSI